MSSVSARLGPRQPKREREPCFVSFLVAVRGVERRPGLRRDGISFSWPDAPLAVTAPHLAAELAVPEGRDDESTLQEGGIGLGVAVPTQSNEPIEIEVRAPLGPLAHVVNLQPGAQAASLADPAGPGKDLRANVLVLLQAC